MSTELVLVPRDERPEALRTYRQLLAGRAIAAFSVGWDAIAKTFKAAWVAIKDAFARAMDAVRAMCRALYPMLKRQYSRAALYGDCQAHYGVRRVTARQYRAWKRMQGRQRAAADELTRMRAEEGL